MYTYPIDYELFTSDEIAKIITFLSLIEDANEGRPNPERLIKGYQDFKKIINSLSMEKQIDREFQKMSGYSIYKTMKNLTK